MNAIDPSAAKIGKSGKVLFGSEPSRLEAAHLARRRSAAMSGLTADDPAHCRIMTQPFGVVHILVSSEVAKHGLPKKPGKRMTPFAPVRASASISPATVDSPSASSSYR
jgi:hypothetical protein